MQPCGSLLHPSRAANYTHVAGLLLLLLLFRLANWLQVISAVSTASASPDLVRKSLQLLQCLMQCLVAIGSQAPFTHVCILPSAGAAAVHTLSAGRTTVHLRPALHLQLAAAAVTPWGQPQLSTAAAAC